MGNNMLFSQEEKNYWKKIIEAALFYEGKPISVKEIACKLGIDEEMTWDILNDLKKDYAFRDGGVLIQNKDLTYFFVINSSINEKFRKLYKVRDKKKNNLTPSAKDVLSIIAFKQPVTKIEIDKYRGSDSSYALRKLIEMEFIYISGKKDVPGKPSMYSTTDEFLKVFGLSSLEQLPDIEDISLDKGFYGD